MAFRNSSSTRMSKVYQVFGFCLNSTSAWIEVA
jgi:hypothetical protein